MDPEVAGVPLVRALEECNAGLAGGIRVELDREE
jgi:hypothetical protein